MAVSQQRATLHNACCVWVGLRDTQASSWHKLLPCLLTKLLPVRSAPARILLHCYDACNLPAEAVLLPPPPLTPQRRRTDRCELSWPGIKAPALMPLPTALQTCQASPGKTPIRHRLMHLVGRVQALLASAARRHLTLILLMIICLTQFWDYRFYSTCGSS
jgi:hypothetical protein